MADEQSQSAKSLDKLLVNLSEYRFRKLRGNLGLPRYGVSRSCFKHVYLSRRKDANPSYLVVYRGRGEYRGVKFVVRMAGRSGEGIHNVAREYRIMKKLHFHPKGIPVPKPIYLCTDKHEIGVSFFIREFAEGSNFVDASFSQSYKLCGRGQHLKFVKEQSQPLTKKDKMALRKSATRTLAKVHRHTKGRTALGKVLSESDRKEYGPGNQSFWKWRTDLWKPKEGREQLQLYNKVIKVVDKAEPTDPCLIHGDFNFRNLVFDESNHVKAVLDWEMACAGDPMSDVAELTLCRARPEALRMEHSESTSTLQEAVWKEYTTGVRRSTDEQHATLPLAMPAGCLRFTFIFQSAVNGEGHECTEDFDKGQLQVLISKLTKEGERSIALCNT